MEAKTNSNIPSHNIDIVLAEETHNFLGKVYTLCDWWQGKPYNRHSEDFPALYSQEDPLYECLSLERKLLSLVRSYLVNPVLYRLLKCIEKIDVELIPSNRPLAWYDNESYERVVGVEFIIKTQGERIGCRYTEPDLGESIFERHGLSKLLVIDWGHNWRLENTESYSSIRINELLSRYYSDDETKAIISGLSAAVTKAKEILGLQATMKLTNKHFYEQKAKTLRKLKTFSRDDMIYRRGEGRKDRELNLSKKRFTALSTQFNANGLCESLVGDESFAKCFLTAEYMFDMFQDGSQIDFTAVVAGYLKAVEQLEYKLMKIALCRPGSDALWITSKDNAGVPEEDKQDFGRKRPYPHVRFKVEYESRFNVTQGSLTSFLNHDFGGWSVNPSDRVIITNALDEFRDECRNSHFHKDNIDERQEAERIRHNAFLVLFYLLGGCKIDGSLFEQKRKLGATHVRYELFAHEVRKSQYKTRRNFILRLEGEDPVKAIRYFETIPPSFDETGKLSTSIPFTIVDSFEEDCDERPIETLHPERRLVISRNSRLVEAMLVVGNRTFDIFE